MMRVLFKIKILIFFIALLFIQSANAKSEIRCKESNKLKSHKTLVGFTYTNRRLYPSITEPVLGQLVIIENNSFAKITGNMLSLGMKFTLPLKSNNKYVTLKKAASYVERLGSDHCIYYGEFVESGIPEWTIVSTKEISSLRFPLPKESNHFYKINTLCVQQGDYDKGEGPPCVKPQLVAVSDINQNNRLEYWYTKPYMWNTGFTLAEETESNDLIVIVESCPSCD